MNEANSISERLRQIVIEGLSSIGVENAESILFSLDQPEDVVHGEFATNVPLVIAKILKLSPRECAEKLVEYIENNKGGIIERVEIAGAGFINFYLTKEVVKNNIHGLLSKGKLFESNNKKALFEYTDPNCFKVFHIGHLMANAIGETLSRIYETAGYEVTRLCYPSDIGRNVAMGVWGVMQKENEKPAQGASLKDKVLFLGKCYAYANEQYENNETAKQEIISVNKAIYEGTDSKIMEVYAEGRALSLEYFDFMYKLLGTKFDSFIFESEVAEPGLAIVKEFLNNGLFEESDGAIVYKGEQDGLHTRVFITAQGIATYEAKDLGNYEKKLKLIPDAYSYVVVTANEQNEYFKVVNKVVEKIHPELIGKLVHIGHGMLRLPDGKMSSRTGKIIDAESLIDEVKSHLKDRMEKSEAEDKEKLANDIAVGAIKFSILKQAIGRDIIFEIDKSISFEGDSGPYLQYTHARIVQLLKKANDLGIKASYIEGLKEIALERKLLIFGDVIQKSYIEKGPHHIINYLLTLTHEFNSLYARQVIVDVNNPNSSHYVLLAEAVGNILKQGLNMLGIVAPEKM